MKIIMDLVDELLTQVMVNIYIYIFVENQSSSIESITSNIIIDMVSGMHFNPLMSKYSQWFYYLFTNTVLLNY